MGKQNLLLDDEQDEQPTIRVNEAYARRFEHNKRREELHRLQEKHPEVSARLTAKAAEDAARAARQSAAAAGGYEDEEEDESSSDDDDDEELDADDDTDKVLETLVRLKQKDPVLKQPDVVLFPQPADSEGDEAAGQAASEGKKSKPMYLRTVLAKQALEGGPVSDDEDEGDAAALPKQPVAHSYAAEQQELKQAFLEAAAEADDGGVADEGGVLRKKASKRSADWAGEEGPGKEQQVNKLLDEYFGKGPELDAAGAFLKSYIANKAWKEPTDGGRTKKRLKGMDGSSSSSDDEGGGSEDGSSSEEEGPGGINVDEDEQFLEEVDRFEAAYNFRYEEPGSHRIQSFPRVIEDSVRRPDERRKRQRDAKAARKDAEKEAREAEIRRLKNLKKQEIQHMFNRIQEEAGIKSKKQKGADGLAEDAAAALSKSGGMANLLDELLEGDFDPDAYDKRMAAAFDDDYYEGDDEHDELFGDAEEELAAEDDVLKPAAEAARGDDSEAAGGFALLHKQLQQQQQQQQEDGSGSEGEEEAGVDNAEAAAARAEQRSQLQRKLEEYYKLDCEDNIGGIPCRFKYRQVPAETFGLSVEDILTLPDKELNQVIGIKKVAAPYRDDSKRLRPNYKALQRIKGEAAAAAAMRQQKRDKQKHKEGERQQRRQQEQQQQQRDQAAQADALQNGQQQQQQRKHKQQHAEQKRRFEQPHGRPFGQAHKQQRQQKHQQQKPLSEMTSEEKQAARLASYAKLTLKPQQQDQQGDGAGSTRHQHKKQKQSGDQAQQGHSRKKKETQPQPQGRLSAVPVDKPLTKAQKKNLLRSLKRKEKQGS